MIRIRLIGYHIFYFSKYHHYVWFGFCNFAPKKHKLSQNICDLIKPADPMAEHPDLAIPEARTLFNVLKLECKYKSHAQHYYSMYNILNYLKNKHMCS